MLKDQSGVHEQKPRVIVRELAQEGAAYVREALHVLSNDLTLLISLSSFGRDGFAKIFETCHVLGEP